MFTSESLSQHGSATAVQSESGETLTYAQLAMRAKEFGAALEPHTLILLACENTVETLVAYLGSLMRKVVPLMIQAEFVRDAWVQLVARYQPEFAWVPDDLSLPNAEVLIRIRQWQLVKLQPLISSLPEDLGLLFTTSGSTGSPKLVRVSRANLHANATSIVDYLQLHPGEKPITTLPLSYSYGLSVINSHLLAGATVVLTSRQILQREFWELLRATGATSFAGVPYHYEMLKRLGLRRLNAPSLRTFTQAGGKMQEKLVREVGEFCAETQRRLVVMYGQTEATARIAYLPPDRVLEKIGSIGVPIPGGGIEIRTEEGREAGPGEIGEIVYSGPNVTLGYAESRADLCLGDQHGGVLFTGDIARRDSEGFLYIIGRKKRFVKLFGNRVSLDEAESIVKEKFPDSACVGNDERLTVYVTTPGVEPDIVTLLTTRMQMHHSAFRVSVIPEIPKLPSGKTSYAALTG